MTLEPSNRKTDPANPQSAVIRQVSDAASFWGVILFSAAAVALIALATPFVLAIAAITGLVAGDKPHSTWRPARA